jgi:protein phosphatase
VLAVVVVSLLGARLYLDSQWYVGVDNGKVAVYRGIPKQLLGIDLSHVVTDTAVRADRAESLRFYRGRLEEGISAESEEDAQRIVGQIQKDVDAIRSPSPPPPSPTPSPAKSPNRAAPKPSPKPSPKRTRAASPSP